MRLLVIFALNTSFVLFLLALTLAFHRLLKRPQPCQLPDEELPSVSIVIPVRNEERQIERSLRSLALQSYPRFEIVVFDDQSEDATAAKVEALAREFPGMKLIRASEPPPLGWNGKTHALARAVEHTSGDWLFFSDADTEHKPNSLRDGMGYAIRAQARLLSLWPTQELGSFWERVVMPVIWGSFFWFDPFHTVNDFSFDTAYAIGQYLLVERRAYLCVGGHAGVRDSFIDDHDLAKGFKYRAFNLLVADGRQLYTTRMYQSGKALWYGWTKTLFRLMEYNPLILVIVILCINAMCLMPFLELSVVAAMWFTASVPDHYPVLVGLVAAQLVAVFIWWMRMLGCYRGLGLPYLLFVPAGSLVATAVCLNSAWCVWKGRTIRWKDREYPQKRSGRHLSQPPAR